MYGIKILQSEYFNPVPFLAQYKVMIISKQPFPIQIMIDEKQLENVDYYNYSDSMMINDARCTH
jgi:hypothetical protein